MAATLMILTLSACQSGGGNPSSPSSAPLRMATSQTAASASQSNDQSTRTGSGWVDGNAPGEGGSRVGIESFTATLADGAIFNGTEVGAGVLTLEPILRRVCYLAQYDRSVYIGERQGEVHIPASATDLDGPLYPDPSLHTGGEVLMPAGECIKLPAHTFTRLQQDLGRLPDGYTLIVRFDDGQKIGGPFDR